MEEALYDKLKENEKKIKQWGPHVSGLINVGCNTLLYPLFQLSAQLQLSNASSPTYHGRTFNQRLYSFIFEPHQANRPFKPQLHPTYYSAILGNSLQGVGGFYKGFSMAANHFYMSIVSRSVGTSLVYKFFPEESLKWRPNRIMLEALISSACEMSLHPLFIGQTRLIVQNRLEKFRIYQGWEVFKHLSFKEMYIGWGGVFPRQLFLSCWLSFLPEIDFFSDEILGMDGNSIFQVLIKEAIIGVGAYLVIYPILTVQRRLASFSGDIGMFPKQFGSVTGGLWWILRNEGFTSLYRGVFVYSIGLAFWLMAMPTLTQAFWQKFEISVRQDIQNLLDFDLN